MASPKDYLAELRALAASPARRIEPKAAAERFGVHRRTLEEWRRSWRRAEKEGKPELRRGPRFVKVGKRVLYEVRDLDEAKALRDQLANGVSTEAAAKRLGRHPRTLENWRRWWRRAEREGKPELRRGPKFLEVGGSVSYAGCDLDEFLASSAAKDEDKS